MFWWYAAAIPPFLLGVGTLLLAVFGVYFTAYEDGGPSDDHGSPVAILSLFAVSTACLALVAVFCHH